MTWHALSWLDAYAGAEAILNLAAADFDANGSSTSRTDCLLGFGGHVGLEAKLTDCLGLYGQVGYEWVDASAASAGGLRTEAFRNFEDPPAGGTVQTASWRTRSVRWRRSSTAHGRGRATRP